MKHKVFVWLSAIFLLTGLAACSAQNTADSQPSETAGSVGDEEIESVDFTEVLEVSEDVATKEDTEKDITEDTTREEEKMDQNQFYITAGETTFTADFNNNSSAEALKVLLMEKPLTIAMHDYGSFEKVGEIGSTLPRNDEQITTEPGDVILYLGTDITIYYDKNSWNFTRLGKIQDVTKEDLLAVFGDGDVTVTFSLEKPE